MNYNTLKPSSPLFPKLLRRIPQSPKQLFVAGDSLTELLARPRVTVVGARAMTPYGRQVTAQLAGQLAERGIVIISGLALGVDTVALKAALDAGGQTIAVLPSPLDNIVPTINRRLAQRILDTGGVLISEYTPGVPTFKHNFVERNRLMSGLADAVLVTEAATKSGTLHTAEFAHEQGREVLAVPGNITSKLSQGTNQLIKDGAAPITSYSDILDAMGLTDTQTKLPLVIGRNHEEQVVLGLIQSGIIEGHLLLKASYLSPEIFNQTISTLEISGKIHSIGGNRWAV